MNLKKCGPMIGWGGGLVIARGVLSKIIKMIFGLSQVETKLISKHENIRKCFDQPKPCATSESHKSTKFKIFEWFKKEILFTKQSNTLPDITEKI